MNILILTPSSTGNTWTTRTIELEHMPRAGDFIATGDTDEGDWYEVRATAQIPKGGKFEAKIIAVGTTEAQLWEQALSAKTTSDPSQWQDRYRLVTEEEAAAIAKVHPRTIRRLIDKGKLPAVNYGLGSKKIYRVKPEDLGMVQPVALPPPPQRRQRRATPQLSAAPWPPATAVGLEPDPYTPRPKPR
jgi:excisionase family DNA binding protein